MYVPRGRRSQTTPRPHPTINHSTAANSNGKEPFCVNSTTTTGTHSNANTPSEPTAVNPSRTQYNVNSEIDNHCAEREQQPLLISVERVNINCDQTNNLQNSAPALSDREKYLDTTNMPSNKLNIQNQCNINSNDAVPETRNSDKDYNEDKEFQRASKV